LKSNDNKENKGIQIIFSGPMQLHNKFIIFHYNSINQPIENREGILKWQFQLLPPLLYIINFEVKAGGAERNRTVDFLTAIRFKSQLINWLLVTFWNEVVNFYGVIGFGVFLSFPVFSIS